MKTPKYQLELAARLQAMTNQELWDFYKEAQVPDEYGDFSRRGEAQLRLALDEVEKRLKRWLKRDLAV